ncbi:MAG: hypothetical protein ACK5PC_06210 [Cyclobacteriaceae bacterium]
MLAYIKSHFAIIWTSFAVAFSITSLNSIITTIILLLTAAWWIQKNIKEYKKKD